MLGSIRSSRRAVLSSAAAPLAQQMRLTRVQVSGAGAEALRARTLWALALAAAAGLPAGCPQQTPPNQEPVAHDQSVNVPFDTATPITLSATDDDGPQPLTYIIVATPTRGTLSGPSDGTVVYTPRSGSCRPGGATSGHCGTDSFTFKVSDGLAESAAATVSIRVGQYASGEVGDDLPLRLPWPSGVPGEPFCITQGYCADPDHHGYEVDFSLPEGTPVVAVADGTIDDVEDFTGNSPTGYGPGDPRNAGTFVKIRHDGASTIWYSSYLHLAGRAVSKGERVVAGQIIGSSGNTGWSTGAHLHLHIRNGPTSADEGFRPVPMTGIVESSGASMIADFEPLERYFAIGDVAVPAHDTCPGATGALLVPSTTMGTTWGATSDTAPTCGATSATAPSVWYKLTGAGETLIASLCGSAAGFDARLSVFRGTCTNLTCVTEGDDCCGRLPRVSWYAESEKTYFVLVHGYGGATGSFRLDLSAGSRLLAHDTSGKLYIVDPDTGAADVLRSVNTDLYDIAFSPTGRLYGLSSDGDLYELSLASSEARAIGTLGMSSNCNALLFDEAGVLWTACGDILATVDAATGQATVVSDLDGYDSAGDLVLALDGQLLLTTTQGSLIGIDRTSFAVSVRAQLGAADVYGLERLDDGRLVGLTGNNHILLINEATGQVSAGPAISSVCGGLGATGGAARLP